MKRIIIRKKINENVNKIKMTNPNIGDLITISTYDDFMKYAEVVWNLLILSYEKHGGLKSYRNFKDFIRKQHLIEIVVLNNNILAAATYRKMDDDSLKLVAIGCDQTDNGILAIQQIIKHSIDNADIHYWAEVSGAIEHYFKKYDGFPMPNVIAHEILEINSDDIILSSNDNVHYERPIGPDRDIFEKMIFGIKSEEIFNKAIAAVENYSTFMKEINSINEGIKIINIKQAFFIINNIYRAHEEDGFNELIPSWHNALLQSLNILKSVNNPERNVKDYIRYAEYLLDDMQLLTLHKF